jgi:S1-C subfamily serine protease
MTSSLRCEALVRLIAATCVLFATANAHAVNPDVSRTCSGVCEIQVEYRNGDISLGSGFLVDREHGLVVTNFHVINGGFRGTLSFEGIDQRFAFESCGYSIENDLAILRVDAKAHASVLEKVWEFELAGVDPAPASTVFAIGYPGGLGFTVKRGIVTALRVWGTQIDPNGTNAKFGIDPASRWIVHDCGTKRGNSGGPLVDEGGRAIGVNTFGLDGAVPPVDLASPSREIRELLKNVNPESGVAWSAVEDLANAVSEQLKLWSVPDVAVRKATATSTMTSIRALPRVAACPKCNGDGDVQTQRTIRSGRQFSKGTIIRGEKACPRCGGDGYNRDWSRVSSVLGSLTKKIAGLNSEDSRYEQAMEQFFDQLSPVVTHTPRNWAALVNADCFSRMRRPRNGEAIFGVGACSWDFELRGLGRVTLVVPAVDSTMTQTYYFVMIDPILDNRQIDDIQYAFWGGIIADVQELVGEKSVVFIRRGFLMTDS